MIFTSFEFLCFFLAVILLLSCLRGLSAQKWLLLAASYCFYLTWSVPCSALLIFISLSDYYIGRKLGQTENPIHRKRLLISGLVVNLGLLGFFKYSNFVLDNIWLALSALGMHFHRPHYDIILPPAISYFTFASMSYVLDVYYERIHPTRSLRDYSLFISFFPKLLAGPIMRAGDFLSQVQQRICANAAAIESGLCYFLLGAVKKLVISDQVASPVNLIFSSPGQYDGLTLLLGAMGYAVQIYCDFSGYSDMAIGSALILGIKLPENFQMPYSSVTITEFWRRWHIALSAWFRDYVFIPMEIARKNVRSATLRTTISLTTTMLLCGLWHGAGWTFVIWGGIHGVALAVHRAWTTWDPLRGLADHRVFQAVWTLFSRLLTLSIVLVAWIFFRAQSLADAGSYLSRMLFWRHDGMRWVSPYILLALAAVFFTHLLVNKDRNWAQELRGRAVPVRITAYAALVVLLSFFGATSAVPFIYFQF
jgi:alginate O-acetyltransferase complex protein AlgI